jgi:DNA-binding SARP family transcriptional activator
VEVRLLGPVGIVDGARAVAVPGVKQRTTLATLALHAGEAVPVERLVDIVWGERAPRTARRQVLNCVSSLRRILGTAMVTAPTGYALDPALVTVDLRAFEAAVSAGRAAAAQHRTEDALDALDAALALWRGPALGGTSGLAAHSARLDDVRLGVVEERAELLLALGRHAGLVAELTELVNEHPHHEGLVGALMLALYHAGRQADALRAYGRAVAALADGLGIDPGPALRRRHGAFLRGDVAAPARPVEPEDPPAVRPAQLPAASSLFVGRVEPLRRLDELLSDVADERTAAAVIAAVAGPAGIGKTALALHWAHRVADRFPDGQLYVNLRGYDPDEAPMPPATVVRGFLHALDVPAQRIPAGAAAQVDLYRSLMSGRRMLVVLDNARDADQVRPLLPGSRGCLAVVTSRNQLGGLLVTEGARLVRLDLLPVDEARGLLARRLGEERVAAEPPAVTQIIDACARLPLALAIVGARAAAHPHFTLAALAKELQDVRTDLGPFTSGDSTVDIRATFSWSYRSLSPGAAHLFRLLGLHPGPDISLAAAASTAGVDAGQIRPLLAELARANLVNEHAPGRYALHDLLRAYAGELARGEDAGPARAHAVRRLLDHYLHSAFVADRRFNPTRDPIPLEPARPDVRPEHPEDPRSWFATEHAVLLACVHLAASAGLDEHVWRLAWTLSDHLEWQGHWDAWAETQTAAVAAATRLAQPAAQAVSLRLRARANIRLARLDQASADLRQALRHYHEANDPVGQGHAHIDLGVLCEAQGQSAVSLHHAEQALRLHRAAGHRSGQAQALNNGAWYHAAMGDHERALDCCQQAIPLYEELGNLPGQGVTWDTLGYIHRRLGNHADAVACHLRALDLVRDLGDRYIEGAILVNLGEAHQAAGNVDDAVAVWRQALPLLDAVGHADAANLRTRLREVGVDA